jgi:hypothetical protein
LLKHQLLKVNRILHLSKLTFVTKHILVFHIDVLEESAITAEITTTVAALLSTNDDDNKDKIIMVEEKDESDTADNSSGINLLLDDDEEEDDGIEVVEDGVGDDGDGVGGEEGKQEIDPLGNKPLTDDLNQQGEEEKATVV